MKRLISVVALAGLAIAGVGAWWIQNRGPTQAAPAGQAAPGGQVPGARDGNVAMRPAGPGGGPGTGGGPGGGGGPVAVEVGKVQAARLTDDVQAVGSLRSRQGVMVRPEVSGRVARLGFQDGQRVRMGQLLVQLDDTLQAAQLRQAEAQAGIARTNLQRGRELLAQGFVSQSSVDQSAAALEVAEAQVALARAQLGRMRVLAPFDGTAGIGLVDVGDYLKDGADIVNLEDLAAMSVDFRAPERYVDRLRPGNRVEVAVDALPGRTFAGRVEALDSQVNADGRAVLVRARVDNPGALLRPGMFARVRVVFAVREGAVVVPEEAVVPLAGRPFVFRVADGPGGQKVAQRVEARIGVRLPGQVEILEGLAPGETVVTAGQARLARGDNIPVRVIDLAAGPRRPGAGASAPSAGAPAGSAPTAAASAAR